MPVVPAPDLPAGDRFALLIGTAGYADERFAGLSGPLADVELLAEVLAAPDLGGFEVTKHVDPSMQEMRIALESFLRERRHGDLAVVYISGHGVVDKYNELYFAARDTNRDLLAATAIEADWLRSRLGRCPARRQVLILDCCHAGAYAGAKNDGDLRLDRFAEDARGRLVFHAARASELAFVADEADLGSVYTAALVEGLRTGAADLDGDGYVGAVELHEYVERRLRELGASQKPQLTVGHSEGTIILSRSPKGWQLEPATLPDDIVEDLEHPKPGRRIGAVFELARWLEDVDPARVLAARLRLEEVVARDVAEVADVARGRLKRSVTVPAPEHVVVPEAAETVSSLVVLGVAAEQPSRGAGNQVPEADVLRVDDRALATLDEIEDLVLHLPEASQKASALAAVASAVYASDPDRAGGLLNRALRIANSVGSPVLRAGVLAEIAPILAVGNREHASRVADRIGEPAEQSRAWAGIAVVLARTDADQAVAAFNKAQGIDAMSQAWAEIVSTVAARDPLRAERMTGPYMSAARLPKLWAGIAAVVATRDPVRAERLAADLEDAAERARTFGAIAAAVVAADPARAKRLLTRVDRITEAMQDREAAVWVQLDVRLLLGATSPGRARSLVASLGTEITSSSVLARIAAAVAVMDPDGAEMVARRIDDPLARIQALASVAKAWLEHTHPDDTAPPHPDDQ